MKVIWRSGNGKPTTMESVLAELRAHVAANGRIYIGTDSYIDKSRCAFATAICLHGADGQSGGKYFFRKVYLNRQNFPSLVQRILREVQDSIEIALTISEKLPAARIELHLDVSPSNKENGTSKISEMVTGYAKSSGFECKIKPEAWASQSVADKHSK
tara:strand:- start:2016 stop:2489 length:474 start_codon:yes stop_codon:yes gene_type:complete